MGKYDGATLRAERRLTAGLVDHDRPAISPDGAMIAYSAGLEASSQIFLCDAEGRFIRQLTSGRGLHSQVAWSPDCQTLAYAWRKTEHGRWQVWLGPRDPGAASECVLTSTRFSYSHPVFAASGDGLFFDSNQGQGSTYNLWHVSFDGGVKTQLFDDPDRHNLRPTASPNGRWVVFEAGVDPDVATALVLFDLDTEELVELLDDHGLHSNPSFVSDTAIVYERREPGQPGTLWIMDVRTGERSELGGAEGVVQAVGLVAGSGHGTIAWASRGPEADNGRYEIVVGALDLAGGTGELAVADPDSGSRPNKAGKTKKAKRKKKGKRGGEGKQKQRDTKKRGAARAKKATDKPRSKNKKKARAKSKEDSEKKKSKRKRAAADDKVATKKSKHKKAEPARDRRKPKKKSKAADAIVSNKRSKGKKASAKGTKRKAPPGSKRRAKRSDVAGDSGKGTSGKRSSKRRASGSTEKKTKRTKKSK